MNLFALSIFLSAFLLFQVQPMIGKYLLPWFGGTPAIWTTVMLFFQVLLTAGYAYAHWLVNRFAPARQALVHSTLVLTAVVMLAVLAVAWPSPVMPGPDWKPADVGSPVRDIFTLLTISVGLPYFILAANGPLMQAWFSHAWPDQSYARLFSLSNLGSLSGLLVYPTLVEPTLPLRWQSWAWSGGFVTFAFLTALISARSRSLPSPPPMPAATAPREVAAAPAPLSLTLALSATPSLLLLAVTNAISQDIAVVPFLWIAPLMIYLLSFILAFSGEYSYRRGPFSAVFVALTGLTLVMMVDRGVLPIAMQITTLCLLLFCACMICHGELYRLRPPAPLLTSFYLRVSLGGALGGVFVGLIAPVIFNGYWEFFIGLAMTAVILMATVGGKPGPDRPGAIRARLVIAALVVAIAGSAAIGAAFPGAAFASRNFYGIIRVAEAQASETSGSAFVMANGITVHGLQFTSAGRRNEPTTYYVRDSGAGLAIRNHPRYGQGLRVALLGLGIGTLAAYGQPGDQYRLYEINPVVIELASGREGYFSFLSDSMAEITTIPGDARLSLERELATRNPQRFDVMVLDTFSSDSIPVHLVTKEAFATYLGHLAPGGVIAAHVTNQHLDLQPVLWRLARHYGLEISRVDDAGDVDGGYASEWILLSRDRAVLDIPTIRSRSVSLDGYVTDLPLWTDDYSNLLQILK